MSPTSTDQRYIKAIFTGKMLANQEMALVQSAISVELLLFKKSM
jgi:hypothetical protein